MLWCLDSNFFPPYLLWDRINFTASLWVTISCLFNGVFFVDIQRDWEYRVWVFFLILFFFFGEDLEFRAFQSLSEFTRVIPSPIYLPWREVKEKKFIAQGDLTEETSCWKFLHSVLTIDTSGLEKKGSFPKDLMLCITVKHHEHNRGRNLNSSG